MSHACTWSRNNLSAALLTVFFFGSRATCQATYLISRRGSHSVVSSSVSLSYRFLINIISSFKVCIARLLASISLSTTSIPVFTFAELQRTMRSTHLFTGHEAGSQSLAESKISFSSTITERIMHHCFFSPSYLAYTHQRDVFNTFWRDKASS